MSLNVATCVVAGSTCPSTTPVGNVIAPFAKTSASVTVPVLAAVTENPGSLFSKKVVLTVKEPSSA